MEEGKLYFVNMIVIVYLFGMYLIIYILFGVVSNLYEMVFLDIVIVVDNEMFCNGNFSSSFFEGCY